LVYTMTQLWFYGTHRLLHHPRLYVLHKKHHKYIVPPPYATFYCSLTEHLVVNTGSLLVPLYLCPLPYWITLIYAFLVFDNAVQGHMGIKYPDSEHLIHHKLRHVNFGAGSFLDILFGTHHSYVSKGAQGSH
jgi:sterol desaturase/sphingolipid hydroxylase (fatty acid hydroxylase superfamily)